MHGGEVDPSTTMPFLCPLEAAQIAKVAAMAPNYNPLPMQMLVADAIKDCQAACPGPDKYVYLQEVPAIKRLFGRSVTIRRSVNICGMNGAEIPRGITTDILLPD